MHAVAPEWASAIVLVSSAYIHVLFTVSMTHEGGILGAADISLGSEVVNHEERLDYVERLGVDAGPASTFIISVRMIPLAGSYSSMHMHNQTQVSNITSVPQSVAVWIRTTCARDVFVLLQPLPGSLCVGSVGGYDMENNIQARMRLRIASFKILTVHSIHSIAFQCHI